MSELTLVIPAKNEAESLPQVLNELKKFNFKIIVSVDKEDDATINEIKKFDCDIVFQSKKGYGNAIRSGVGNVKTQYFSIFNADGSFKPDDLTNMLSLCEENDFVFASRYIENGGSDDDTVLTLIGNFIFTKITNIFFKIKISDILYTFVVGKTKSFERLNMKTNDFSLCVELPIKAKQAGMKLAEIPSHERKRIAGRKKVNEFIDGFKILSFLVIKFFNKKY